MVLLDVSRLVSRAGRSPTGVDRVELAYLKKFSTAPFQSFALARTALGFVLLDQQGMALFLRHWEDANWPHPDFVSRMNTRLSGSAKVGQTAVRSLAVDRARPSRLAQLIRRRLPGAFSYFNVGHSNLSKRVLRSVSAAQGAKVIAMIHDTIPLDSPEFQRPASQARFKVLFENVAEFADHILCPSEAEAKNVKKHLADGVHSPTVTATHLGVELAPEEALPPDLQDKPFFMTLGTIEPRKNHALLLDIWRSLRSEAPLLVICGSRGWENAKVFNQLDRGVSGVLEMPDVSDGMIFAMMRQTSGFLFPSFREGFGLPPVEAALAGAPILCADLPSCREILGDKAVYLDPTDRYQWENAVRALLSAKEQGEEQPFVAPTWDAHFKTVFTIM